MINELISESVNLLEASVSAKNAPSSSLDQLQKDLLNLKQYIENKRIVHVTSGSGEVRILRMDDVNTSDIANGRMLIWSASQKKFRFVDVPSNVNLVNPTTLITADYTATADDYYIGVNSETTVSITLPNTIGPGKEYIIKDEAGNAALAPIKILGTIDNDPAGVELRINNGSVTVIYRNGWRII